jgi:hypothetical protein
MSIAHNATVPQQNWLGRLVLALLIGLLAGILTYLTARAIGSVWLLVNQRELVEATQQALQQGVMGLVNSNLRTLRMIAEAQQRWIAELSIWLGLGVGLVTAIGTYIRLELNAGES